MQRLRNLFKFRLRLVQMGYDKGWEHGFQAGMDEQQKQILDLLNKHIHGIDWTKEDAFTVKDVIPVVEEHNADKEPVGWK
jgi:hypothetical protein